jgi:hypothetical protein
MQPNGCMSNQKMHQFVESQILRSAPGHCSKAFWQKTALENAAFVMRTDGLPENKHGTAAWALWRMLMIDLGWV